MFYYDDENQLTSVTVSNAWRSEFAYDGMMRRRIRKEYTWQSSAWLKTNEVRYVYDGRLVIQEQQTVYPLDTNPYPLLVTYTRERERGRKGVAPYYLHQPGCSVALGHAPCVAHRISWRNLSRHEPWRPPRTHLPRRP